MSFLNSPRTSLWSILTKLDSVRKTLFSVGVLDSPRASIFTVEAALESMRFTSWTVTHPSFSTVFMPTGVPGALRSGGGSGYGLGGSSGYGGSVGVGGSVSSASNALTVPPVEFTFSVAGSVPLELSESIKSLTITRPYSGQAHCSATFLNYVEPTTADLTASTKPYLAQPVNRLHGTPPNTAPPNKKLDTGVLRHHNQTTRNQVNIGLKVLGQSCTTMPVFLGGGYQDNQPQGSWNCYDFSYFLDVENQHMPDIVETSPAQKAHETFMAIASRYGIPEVDMRFPDYTVRQLRRDRGTPRGWLGLLGKPYQTGQRFHGTKLIAERFDITGKDNPQWGYKAGVNFKSFTWKEAEPPPKNRFTLNRLDPQKGIIGKQKCVGESCPGRTVHVQINPPSRQVRITENVSNGVIENWVFVTQDGQYKTALIPGTWNGEPVVEAIATYKPTIDFFTGQGQGIQSAGNQTSASYGYDLLAYGASVVGNFLNTYKAIFPPAISHTIHETFPHAPPVTRVILSPEPVTDDQRRYGIVEDFQNIEDPIVPNKKVLDDYGKSVLLESTRKTFTGILETPFINPKIEPGHWVQIDAPMEGWPDKTAWHVELITYTYNNGSWMMALTLTCGLWNLV